MNQIIGNKMNLTILIAEVVRPAHQHLVALEDCIMFENGKCTALEELCCKQEECKFYKYKGE